MQSSRRTVFTKAMTEKDFSLFFTGSKEKDTEITEFPSSLTDGPE
jgi:hypothetical protein